MKLIKPSYEIKEQEFGLSGICKQIEWAGRHCYKSLDKITENSAKDFVDRMVKSGHGAMLEHGTVYLKIRKGTYAYDHYVAVCEPNDDFMSSSCELPFRPYTKVNIQNDYIYVTTNYRVLIEHNWLNDLEYLCEPTEYHEKRVTVRFVADAGVMREFFRHRVFSMAQESTRYCNYSKNKFGSELTFIIPCWVDEALLKEVKGTIISKDDYGDLICEYYYHLSGKQEEWFKPWPITPERNFIVSLQIAEQLYLELLNQGWKPQEARAILPLSIKAEGVMTGFVSDWKHFFSLRALGTTGAPHPQAKELAEPLMKEFERRGLLCTTQ